MIDKEFIRSLRRFLLKYNDLRDHGFVGKDGAPRYTYTNETLNYFRNHPGEAYKEVISPRTSFPHRIYRPGQITFAEIANHLVTQAERTVWIVNKANVNTLLIAGDIDDKERRGDAQGLAEYFRDQYLGGRGYIEPSRSGHGRHVYFLLDVEFIARRKVWEGMIEWARLVQRDTRVQAFGAVFDRFLGLPTLWDEVGGRQVIERRGNLLKVPYLPNDEDDLHRLQNLVPLSFETIMTLVEAGETASGSKTAALEGSNGSSSSGYEYIKGDMGVTSSETRHSSLGIDIGDSSEYTKGDMGVTDTEAKDKKAANIERHDRTTDPNTTDPDAFKKKISCVDRLLKATNGAVSLKTVLDEYQRKYNPTGMYERDIRRRTVLLGRILKKRRSTFVRSQSQSKPFKKGEYLELVRRLVPMAAFEWDRRDRIDHERLADFISIKVQDAFYVRHDGYFAAASRNATMANMKTMRSKGLIDWCIVPHQYTRLLKITVQYGLLEVVEEYLKPRRSPTGKSVWKGRARIIGPGAALPELRVEFLARYEQWRLRQQSQAA